MTVDTFRNENKTVLEVQNADADYVGTVVRN